MITELNPEWRQPASLPGYYVSRQGLLFHGLKQVAVRPDNRGCAVATAFVRHCPGTVRISRLVGECFCDGFHPDKRAKYLNGNGMDCRPENLEWVSRSEVAKAACQRKEAA